MQPLQFFKYECVQCLNENRRVELPAGSQPKLVVRRRYRI